ncbi:unnamed protein product [Paramecium sonneborni]|uniref:Uncharacterized protein n=1 Tax=Paramecium sonneborni TaxID=65129 RepID=A0A8S1JYU7_9CILI|nr:unnamed protein product [Paramecium sonneborni]
MNNEYIYSLSKKDNYIYKDRIKNTKKIGSNQQERCSCWFKIRGWQKNYRKKGEVKQGNR